MSSRASFSGILVFDCEALVAWDLGEMRFKIIALQSLLRLVIDSSTFEWAVNSTC